jgi:hypothetical protein
MQPIRTLKASEIDCRIGQVFQSKKAVSVLLYKDARCDMAILDELVGPENWQREHYECKGNLFCRVGIRNQETGEWVWKSDCGVESATEAVKGESSDSFKRASVAWGLGRELYTAPFIYIQCTDKEWNNGKPRLDLSVMAITYNDQREIDGLMIVDKDGDVRFDMCSRVKPKKEAVKAEEAPLDNEVKPLNQVLQELRECRSRKEILALNNEVKMHYGQYAEHPSQEYISLLNDMCKAFPKA